jgi:hypothetical protein
VKKTSNAITKTVKEEAITLDNAKTSTTSVIVVHKNYSLKKMMKEQITAQYV